jgi:hypothetical protein
MRDTMSEVVSFNRLSRETFCAIYDLSTSKLPHLPVQAIQGQSTMIDINALLQDQAIPCIFTGNI